MEIHIDLSQTDAKFGLYASAGYELTAGGLSLAMSAEQFAQLCDNLRPWVIEDTPQPSPAAHAGGQEAVAWLHKNGYSLLLDSGMHHATNPEDWEPLYTQAPAPMLVDAWQPIATAPKDGTWVLLAGGAIRYGWDGNDPPRCVAGQFTDELNGADGHDRWQFAWYDGGYYGEYESPTHWQPLPPALLSGGAAQEGKDDN